MDRENRIARGKCPNPKKVNPLTGKSCGKPISNIVNVVTFTWIIIKKDEMKTGKHYIQIFIESGRWSAKRYLRLISHYKVKKIVFYRVYETPYDSDEILFILNNIDW